MRLYKKVSKSRETFKVRDFVNTSSVSVAQLNICTTLAKTFFLAFPIC